MIFKSHRKEVTRQKEKLHTRGVGEKGEISAFSGCRYDSFEACCANSPGCKLRFLAPMEFTNLTSTVPPALSSNGSKARHHRAMKT